MPVLPSIVLWAALATGVSLPRWLYLVAEWSASPSLRTFAWAGDVVCLVAAAFALWRLQRAFGDDESRLATYFAIPAFLVDAVTTFAVPWVKAPAFIVVAAIFGWTFGTSRWLVSRCSASGAPYFLFNLTLIVVIVSVIYDRLRPDGPAFPLALLIDTGIAVQCILVARASNEMRGSAP